MQGTCSVLHRPLDTRQPLPRTQCISGERRRLQLARRICRGTGPEHSRGPPQSVRGSREITPIAVRYLIAASLQQFGDVRQEGLDRPTETRLKYSPQVFYGLCVEQWSAPHQANGCTARRRRRARRLTNIVVHNGEKLELPWWHGKQQSPE